MAFLSIVSSSLVFSLALMHFDIEAVVASWRQGVFQTRRVVSWPLLFFMLVFFWNDKVNHHTFRQWHASSLVSGYHSFEFGLCVVAPAV